MVLQRCSSRLSMAMNANTTAFWRKKECPEVSSTSSVGRPHTRDFCRCHAPDFLFFVYLQIAGTLSAAMEL